jgi:parvulin-like peptidyl-prolyl isomerase
MNHSWAEDKTPKYTVEEIMKAVFKGDDSIAKKAGKGEASKADLAKLEDYVASLPLNDAPQGDSADWKKKTTAVAEAVTALKTGKPDALARYNLAVDCKACHSIYRPQ